MQVRELGTPGTAPVVSTPVEQTQQSGIVSMGSGEELLKELLTAPKKADQIGNNTGESFLSPYLICASEDSPNWSAQQLAGLKAGEFAINQSNTLIKCHPLEFFISYSEGFAMIRNTSGQILYASRNMKKCGEYVGPNKIQETYIVALIVNVNGILTPVNAECSGTKAPMIANALAKLALTEKPDFARMGEREAFAASVQLPWARLMNRASTTSRKVVRGPNVGNDYHLAIVNSTPIDGPQFQKLTDTLQDKTFRDNLVKVLSRFKSNVSETLALVAKHDPESMK